MREAFRIAMREEPDGFVRAYMAPLGSMEGAVLIASISANLMRLDESLFDKFKELVRLAAGVLSVETFGVAPAHMLERERKRGDK